MRDMTVRNADDYTLDDLHSLFGEAIDRAERLVGLLARRAQPAGNACVRVLRQFVAGQVTTDEVKAQFKAMTTTVIHEVPMNDKQTKALLSLAEVAHAGAHLGHLATSMSHGGATHREYDSLQKAYVLFGLEGAKRYADEVLNTSRMAGGQRHRC